MRITVFSNPGCQPCRLTKIHLAKNSVHFREKQIASQPSAIIESWREEGHLAAPIIEIENAGVVEKRFSGYRPDVLDAIIAAYHKELSL